MTAPAMTDAAGSADGDEEPPADPRAPAAAAGVLRRVRTTGGRPPRRRPGGRSVRCHGIMYFEARHQGMRGIPPTPMGAEGVPSIGLAPFVDEAAPDPEPRRRHALGRSGTLAIRASVAAGVDVTFKILYNAAVAIAGGQDVTGLMDVPSLTHGALEAEGVRRIVVCSGRPDTLRAPSALGGRGRGARPRPAPRRRRSSRPFPA